MRRHRAAMLAAGVLALVPIHLGAQNYRVRVDAGGQSVAFRGLTRDSIAPALVVTGATGGLETPDGYPVQCTVDDGCTFLRPGRALHAIPLTTSATVAVWGLGVEGLSVHATARLSADAGHEHELLAAGPFAQFVEGYVELRKSRVIARAGRQLLSSRLEAMGFDGAHVQLHLEKVSLDVTGYGGWGLGQAAALPVASPALNPLNEWRPRDRQLVLGGDLAWLHHGIDGRLEYRREIDPETHYFVSERSALSLGARLSSLRVVAGMDYNIAEARPGTSDIVLTYGTRRGSISAGARHYLPYFSLWTLWGAFSPVGYDAVNTSGELRPTSWLSLRARAEQYRYANADVSIAVVPQLRNSGWRVSSGVTATLSRKLSFDGNASVEHGPGASGRFYDGTLTFTPDSIHSFDVYGGTMARPLELRYYDANGRWVGARASRQVTAQHRLWADVALISDARNRPFETASALKQMRVRGGVSLFFGSRADRTPLPPARRMGQ